MSANSETKPGDATLAQQLDLALTCMWIFGIVCASVLATLIAAVFFGDISSTFMWIRAAILLAATPALFWLVRRSGRGDISALERLRLVTIVLPIAIVGVDVIPGVCPVWYASLQSVAALALVPVAVVSWRLVARLRSETKSESRNG